MDSYIKVIKCTGIRDRVGISVRLFYPYLNKFQDAIMVHSTLYEQKDLNGDEYIKYYRVKFETMMEVVTGLFAVVLKQGDLGFALYHMVDETSKEPIMILDM